MIDAGHVLCFAWRKSVQAEYGGHSLETFKAVKETAVTSEKESSGDRREGTRVLGTGEPGHSPVPVCAGSLYSHACAQCCMHSQRAPKNALNSRFWLISRVNSSSV